MLHYYRHQARMCIDQCLITLHQILTDHLQTNNIIQFLYNYDEATINLR
jgi:hypothetical protein